MDMISLRKEAARLVQEQRDVCRFEKRKGKNIPKMQAANLSLFDVSYKLAIFYDHACLSLLVFLSLSLFFLPFTIPMEDIV